MGAFSDRAVATASRLLSTYGETISWYRYNTGSYTVNTGTTAITSTTTYSGYAYPTAYSTSQIDGTIIQQGDILLLLSTTTTPLNGDGFVIDSKTYTAQNVQRVTAQGADVLYKVQIRQ